MTNVRQGGYIQSMHKTIRDHIRTIGEDVVACKNYCDGVNLNQDAGIIPRCLIFEEEGRNDKQKGVVIVGMNPGKSKDFERNYYLTNGISYQSVLNCWNQRFSNHKYYKCLRHIADELGFSGPILWTEIVKCESNDYVSPTPETYSICANQYIKSELVVVPVDWPIIAAGLEAYNQAKSYFPERVIIGVPHPTGSRIFQKLFYLDNKLKEVFKSPFDELWNGKTGKSIWFAATADCYWER